MIHNELSFSKRIKQIVDSAYCVLCGKIVNNGIKFYNEASMQLHLGTILKQLGELYEFSTKDNFIIELEASEQINPTQKSSSGVARCDIKISLDNGLEKCDAFIELKYFKKSPNEAVTDNKFSVYCDIENLEKYKTKNESRLCYEIIYTDNFNYTHNNEFKFCIGDGFVISANSYPYTKDRIVKIENNYPLDWDIYIQQNKQIKHCFLKIEL